ncbi:unnamed protein product, partial [Gongylonema pulchrum]|uniref:Uncharacterized protein n=1 Tax=Gongylonema pulchrum TaxID=637853 RepID=A0A183DD65_9BILA
MNVRTAARIVALRPCIEAFLVRTCLNPESAEAHVDEDSKLLSILKRLSSPQAWTGEDNESLAAEQQQQQKYASTDIHRGSYTK